ncbi:MAG TPA: hypothetical protein DEG69_12170 [Flavobacteriaceae bacterium]|nr:hypothetical protein [Flavobacteriaceae bacterium]|tara:strand:+ start:127 stop:477 length:351 start_codon:yes stop_codon:yes gene_type:complete
MKTKKTLKKLHKSRDVHLYRLKPENNNRMGNHYEVSFPVTSHMDLMFLIGNLLKVCIRALSEGEHPDDPLIAQPYYNVQEVLRHILNLIPFGEQEFIDEVTELLDKLEKKEINNSK